jgi:hypothetical protein
VHDDRVIDIDLAIAARGGRPSPAALRTQRSAPDCSRCSVAVTERSRRLRGRPTHAIKAGDDRIGDTDMVHARDDVQLTSSLPR